MDTSTKKLVMAGVLCAVAVAGSLFSIPVFGSRCAPVQHMVNILCGVLLGPGYAVGAAFCASLLRNLLGLGSILAFPGSMFGALLCGIAYKKTKSLPAALRGEVSAPILWLSFSWGRMRDMWPSMSTLCPSLSPRPQGHVSPALSFTICKRA